MNSNSTITMDKIHFIDGKINSELSDLGQPFKTIVGLIIAASFIWGSIGKVFIYKHSGSFNMTERPINVLILLDEIVHHSLIAYRFNSIF
jgi:hypothetical protein